MSCAELLVFRFLIRSVSKPNYPSSSSFFPQTIQALRAVFSEVFKSTMGEEKSKIMCKTWSPILGKLTRDLKDMDYEDDLISLQVSTVQYELVIVEGLIMRDPSKRYRLIAQQYTPACVVPEMFKSLVKGKLSQRLKEKDFSSRQVHKKPLEEKEEDAKVEMTPREHPVETEVLRRREVLGDVSVDRSGRQRKVLQRVLADILAVKPSVREKEQSYRSSRTTWPASVDPELLETVEEKNRLSWLPEKAGEELEKLSVSSGVKEQHRRALKMNRFEGALKVLSLQSKHRRLREKRKLAKKLALTKAQF